MTGVLPSQTIEAMLSQGEILIETPLVDGQIQPASLDLRLGRVLRTACARLSLQASPGPSHAAWKNSRCTALISATARCWKRAASMWCR